MKLFSLMACLLAAEVLWSCNNVKSYDLCVYGGTASGIVAANAAAKMGLNVIVVEPTCRIGGMTTGGLGLTDIGNKYVVKGLALKFYRELGRRYGNLENWIFEPKEALAVMNGYADLPGITILKNRHIASAEIDGGKIKSFLAVDGADTLDVKARWFIDCSYEGDLMALAGVSYRTGREDNSEYAETWNGSQCLDRHQFPDGVDPYVVPGDPTSGLLWGISDRTLKENGAGDDYIQAYNYRICLTDRTDNLIPIEKPADYDPSHYELLLRLMEAQKDGVSLNRYFIWSMMPNRKTDINNKGGFSTDMIGMNHGYPEGSRDERSRILDAHKSYTLGLLYFIAHDERVPEKIRDEVKKWGLPRDEYVECGHWTPQLYVRESRRMVGEYVATQSDCEHRTEAPEGIAYAAYNMDSHNCERVVVEKGGKRMVKNEGNVEIPGGYPYPISYKSITPKREECTNLLVPVCCSASHIAYGSIRMEPVFMCLGQAAGIAVGIAAKEGLERVQDVDYRKINAVFESDPYMDGTEPDVILDDASATFRGEWTRLSSRGSYGPSYHRCEGAGSAEFKFTAPSSGAYDVYNFTHFSKTGKSSKINSLTQVAFPDGTTRGIDASAVDLTNLGQTSSAWEKIGEITVRKGDEYSFRFIGDKDVIADALLLVRK